MLPSIRVKSLMGNWVVEVNTFLKTNRTQLRPASYLLSKATGVHQARCGERKVYTVHLGAVKLYSSVKRDWNEARCVCFLFH